MSDIQSISQGNYILQGTVATSAGIVGDGSTQNPLRADETMLWEGKEATAGTVITLSELQTNFEYLVFGLAGVYDREPIEYKVKVKSLYTVTLEVTSVDGSYVYRWLVNLFGNSTDLTKISISRSIGIRTSHSGSTPTAFTPATTGTYPCGLLYIKGINRINNA